uniref:Leucine-rich PPR motif-containing protein, mitochondrial n=1 Tax=Steinernema glaseri TaxID=37863 RepID=A0A1I7YCX9_9BILA
MIGAATRTNALRVLRRTVAASRGLASAPGASSSNAQASDRPRFPVGGVRRRSMEIQRQRRELLDRHRDSIEKNDMKTFPDICEGLEWQSNIAPQVLMRIVELVRSKPSEAVAQLNDRRAAQLVSAFGNKCAIIEERLRDELFNEFLSLLGQSGFKSGILTHNAILTARLDNGSDVDVLAYLDKLDDEGLDANSETFSLFAEIYARKGDINGVKSVIGLMRDSGLPVTEKALHAMIYALTLKGDRVQAAEVLKSFESNAAISTLGMRLAQVRALTALGDLAGVSNVLADIATEPEFTSPETQGQLLTTMFQLVFQGHHEAVEKIKPFCNNLTEDGDLQLSYSNAQFLLSLLRRAIDQGKWVTAAVLDGIFGQNFWSNRKAEFRNGLLTSVQRNVDSSELLKRAAVVDSLGHIKNSLLWVMDNTLTDNNRQKFDELYNSLYLSEDFKTLISERPHVAYPMVSNLIKQIRSMSSLSDKLPKYKQLCDLLYAKSDATEFTEAHSFFFRAIEKDLQNVGDILSHIKEHRNNIATAIIEGVMKSKSHNLQHLLDLMEGPLNPDGNIRVLSARIGQELVRLLTPGDVTATTLKLASKIVAATFNEDSSSQKASNGYGSKVVSRIMLSPKIAENRIAELVDIWTEEPRISLNADEVSALEKSLNENKMPQRAGLVKQLRRRSKTVVRWMETEDISLLESEARSLSDPERNTNPGVLDRLYTVIINKRATETPKDLLSIARNAQEMFSLKLPEGHRHPRGKIYGILSACFAESLKDMKSAIPDEFWKLPVNYVGVYGLLYALNLCCRGQVDNAKDVLNKIKEKHDKTTITGAFNRICDSAVDVEEQHVKQFVNLLTETFAIPITQRKRLLQLAKSNALKQLLDEKKLTEAFDLVVSESEAHKQMFGQYPMIHACIEAENQPMMKDIFNMIVKFHDRNTAAIDFAITFLEAGLDSSAKKMLEKTSYISSSKLSYIVIRETRLGRPDVLHKLFELVDRDDSKTTSVDLATSLVPKLIGMYEAQENLEDLKRLQAEIKRVSFPLEQKLKSTLEHVIRNLEKRESRQGPSPSQSSTSVDS